MNPFKKAAVGGALLAATLGGGALGASFVSGTAGAQTNPTTTAATASTSSEQPAPTGQAPQDQRDPSKGGHVANGITEKVLTGSDATKAKAAALEAVPGGTVERVETDAEGATYEAHVTKADGSEVTVKFDAAFKVTETVTGHG